MSKKTSSAVMGRPNKISAAVAEEIFMMAGYGMTDSQIAQILKISTDTITRAKKDVDFCGSIMAAKEKADLLVIKSLFHRALGGVTHERKYFKSSNGKKRRLDYEIEKEHLGDPDAIALWLFNRKAHNWKPAKNMEISAPPDETPRALHQIFLNVREKEDVTIRSGKDQLEVLFGDHYTKKQKDKKQNDRTSDKPKSRA